jgi:hypothetical protein
MIAFLSMALEERDNHPDHFHNMHRAVFAILSRVTTSPEHASNFARARTADPTGAQHTPHSTTHMYLKTTLIADAGLVLPAPISAPPRLRVKIPLLTFHVPQNPGDRFPKYIFHPPTHTKQATYAKPTLHHNPTFCQRPCYTVFR